MNSKSPLNALMLLGSGLAAGYLTALYLSPKQRLKQKRALNNLTNQLPEVDIDEVSQKLFGSTTQDMKDQAQDVLNQFQAKLNSLKIAFNMIDEKKYEELVEDFGQSLESEAGFNKRQINQLKKYLSSDYRLLKTSLKS